MGRPQLPRFAWLRTRRSHVRVVQGAPNQQLTATQFRVEIDFFVQSASSGVPHRESRQGTGHRNSVLILGQGTDSPREHLVENLALTLRLTQCCRSRTGTRSGS